MMTATHLVRTPASPTGEPRAIRVLFLTNNPNLGSTARVMTCWLKSGPAVGLHGVIAVRQPGDMTRWLESVGVPHIIDTMPWPKRTWPVPALYHAWKVARWARRHKIDLIDCNEHDVYPFGLLVRRLLRRPIVCRVQFMVNREFCSWAFGGSRRPDGLVWTAQSQKSDCAAAIDGLVPTEWQQVIPLGLDTREFGRVNCRAATRRSWGVGEDSIVIGTASALRPRKRIEDFVELVRRVAADDLRVVGVLAGDVVSGDEAYKARILEQIKTTGLGSRFRWLGNLEPIEPFMHGIDLFINTSEYETFGMSVCESMACRHPVAGYASGSVREVVGETGPIVETGDLDGLTASVQGLIQSPSRLTELGESARRRVVERFDADVSLRQVLSLYDRVLMRIKERP